MDTNTRKRRSGDPFIRYISLRDASRSTHEYIAFALLLCMALQPLQGITRQAVGSNQVIAMFAARRDLIRALGYGLLLNAAVFFIRRVITEGAGIIKDTFLRRPWNAMLLLLLVWSFVCVGHAPDQEVAIGGDPVRFEGILSYIAYAGFFAGACMVRREDLKKTLYLLMGVVSTLLAALSLYCFYNPSPFLLSYMDVTVIGGLAGTFVNTNHYGYYLAIMSVLLFALIPLYENKLLKAGLALMGAFQFVVLLINNTLGSIIAVLAGVFLLLLLYGLRRGGVQKRVTLGGIALLLVCMAGFLIYCVKAPETNQLTRDVSMMVSDAGAILSGNSTGEEGSYRWSVWIAAVKLIKDYPLMGCGTDNAYYVMGNYYFMEKMPHNEYLQHAANMGIPALVLYLGALLWIFLDRLIKLKRLPDITVSALCVTFTYAVSALFGVTLNTVLPFFYIFLAMSAQDEDMLPPVKAARVKAAPKEAPEREDVPAVEAPKSKDAQQAAAPQDAPKPEEKKPDGTKARTKDGQGKRKNRKK